MKQFKFFRGTKVGRLDVLDVENRGTASVVDVGDTRITFAELRETNDDMERWFMEHPEPTQEPIRLFNPVTITVKPNFLTRVKIFGQRVKGFFREIWRYEPIGLVFVTLWVVLFTIFGIAKLFGL